MMNLRVRAMEQVSANRNGQQPTANVKISDYYGTNVFHEETLRAYLSREAFDSLSAVVKSGTKMERNIADQIASGMKAWAMSKGATHYTHWFQPLTGTTAEKH